MKLFYQDPDRQAQLVREAESWLGTPFSENAAIKGPAGGVSCVRFLAACQAAAGACDPLDLPALPVEIVRHWHHHHAASMITDWLARPEVRGRVRRLEPDAEPMTGDMPLLRVGQTEHHLALVCGPHLLHVTVPAGVVRHSIHDPSLRGMVRAFYRVLA